MKEEAQQKELQIEMEKKILEEENNKLNKDKVYLYIETQREKIKMCLAKLHQNIVMTEIIEP